MNLQGGIMLEENNKSWQDLDNLIKKALTKQNKELNEMKYITEKTNYFYNLLMGDLQKKKTLDNNTILLEDKNTKEEYISYYNNLTKSIRIFKNHLLTIKDYLNENSIIKEMVWEESKQYFITFENGMLRVDILNSYIDNDMITSFYYIKNIAYIILSRSYNNLWELISSYEFQQQAKPINTICSEIRANINGEPKCQKIYSITNNEKKFILQATNDKEKNISLKPFENHENVVELAIKHENVLQRKI